MMTNTTTVIDSLGFRAGDMMARAAVTWLCQNGHAVEARANAVGLSAALKAGAHAAVDRALADAKEAIDCGMVQVAETTFQATMALAGVMVAKKFAGEA